MEQENFEPQVDTTEETQNKFTKVTPVSKYLAMALFIILPFIGGWIGYTYAPEKVVEVEKIMIDEEENSFGWFTYQKNIHKDSTTDISRNTGKITYSGFSLDLPISILNLSDSSVLVRSKDIPQDKYYQPISITKNNAFYDPFYFYIQVFEDDTRDFTKKACEYCAEFSEVVNKNGSTYFTDVNEANDVGIFIFQDVDNRGTSVGIYLNTKVFSSEQIDRIMASFKQTSEVFEGSLSE